MGLVSMILERRNRDTSHVGASPLQMSSDIKTRPASPDDIRAQQAISLRTFAMRIDTAKRRTQKLG